MEKEYLTIDEICSRIKFSKQSMYNMISKGTLTCGIHYYKPTKKKLLFDWMAIQEWIERAPGSASETVKKDAITSQPLSAINI